MRFLTLSAALLLLGFVYAEEPSLECAMYAETCETLCVLNVGGELAVPKCAAESSACLCDGVDMSDYVNENSIPYINSLNEKDLIQFVDSSYERYTQMTIEYSAVSPSEDELSQVETPQFNLVLEDVEDDSDEGDELQDQNGRQQGEYVAESKVDVDVEDEDTYEGEEKSTRKSLTRAQDPFCQTFISRCKDDCPAAQSEITCALEDTDSGYMLACVCNGVDISSSVYAQVKAESKAFSV